MGFRIENAVVLFGLFALSIPILIHFFKRRDHETVPWGAMQFLPENVVAERKRWFDELLLMLLRMLMIGLIVIALATPISTSAWLAPIGDRASREVVIVLDGSSSMGLRLPGEATPWTSALAWIRKRIDEAHTRENVTILLARQSPVFVSTAELGNRQPIGRADMPGALSTAWKHLERSNATNKEIVVLTDGQLHGWVDSATLAAMDDLGRLWHAEVQRVKSEGMALPSLRIVTVGPSVPSMLPNYSLSPLVAQRGFVKVGDEIHVESELRLSGVEKAKRPHGAMILVDGQEHQPLSLSKRDTLTAGTMPLRFSLRFDREGQHLISLVVDVDSAHDVLPGDNAQHLVVDVVNELPVLLVDGDTEVTVDSSTYFLQKALRCKDGVPAKALTPMMLESNVGNVDRPAVLVLADVPDLAADSLDAIERFLDAGGGVLVLLGERVAQAKTFYNERLHRDGKGWLPARLEDVVTSKDDTQPDPRSFQHPALELFRSTANSMSQAHLKKWWRVWTDARDRASVIGRLTNSDPFLVEKAYKRGRVIVCTVPPDRRLGSRLPTVAEFPVLVHELTNYLAARRHSSSVLRPGEPIRVAGVDSAIRQVRLRTPEFDTKTIDVNTWPWLHTDTGAVGPYRLHIGDRSWWHLVPNDPEESNLARCTDKDWRRIRTRLPVDWYGEAQRADGDEPAHREELWWLLLLGVVGLLCSEVWMTRRMAIARGV